MKRMKPNQNPIPFPEEICFDVLARLPAKSLMRFKSACKLWLSFTADPFFIQLHRFYSKNRHGNTTLVISYNWLDSPKQQRFNFLNCDGNLDPYQDTKSMPDQFTEIPNIVNGLIYVIGSQKVSICNLSSHVIPTLPSDSIQKQKQRVSSWTCYPCFLFGSDSLGNEYKVLRVRTIVNATIPYTRRNYSIHTLEQGMRDFQAGWKYFKFMGKSIKAHAAIQISKPYKTGLWRL